MESSNGVARGDNLSYEAITRVLFENYESIYDIDALTSAYRCFHESDIYSGLNISDHGDDFFADTEKQVPLVIHEDDRDYVRRMMSREAVLKALENEKYYSFVYRLNIGGRAVYHKVRATMDAVDGRPHIFLGVRNVEETLKHEKAHTDALASMYQKEKNHMEAVMATAAGYLEINLTTDTVLEYSPYVSDELGGAPLRYGELNALICETQIVENRQRYAVISSREYLLSCFSRGEKRASVSFSVRRRGGGDQPCREVFFLYQDNASGDIMAFCVIYDLTERQRREKELRELEHALEMSRIHNSASQMQPHFLYNALGSIQEVMLEDPEYASRLIGDFTVHLRSCIRAMSEEKAIPFTSELENIKAYVNIEKMRFGPKLTVEYDLEATDFLILPLSVQPLVENAIRHGIYKRGRRGGTVVLRTRDLGYAWRIEVEDNGVGFDPSDVPEGSTGLRNIIFRLDKVMNARVNIDSCPGCGTRAEILIPKGDRENESDHS